MPKLNATQKSPSYFQKVINYWSGSSPKQSKKSSGKSKTKQSNGQKESLQIRFRGDRGIENLERLYYPKEEASLSPEALKFLDSQQSA